MNLEVTALLILSQALSSSSEDDCANTTFSLLTFNVALTPMVSSYEERRARIPEALEAADADVICLQEVTYEEDMRFIMDQLKKKYPYSWSFLHSTIFTEYEIFRSPQPDQKPFPCDTENYNNFSKCLQENCEFSSGYFLALCGMSFCSEHMFSLPTDCLSCIAGSLETTDIVTAKCASNGTGDNEGRMRYQPEDILLLSKLPIETAKRVKFIHGITQVYPRGLLEANIYRLGKVVCTHLTADLSSLGLPYIEVKVNQSLGISSFVEQQRDELDQIKSLYGTQNLILVGDLNTGPSNSEQDVDGEITEHYNSLLAGGFDSPYVDTVGQCTYCADNLIAWPANTMLDHVLLRGYKSLSVSRIFDNASDPLSDHYGISITFCRN